MAHAKSTDPNIFILPDLGEGVHEAELISWKVSPGDHVDEHDIVAEMETDKALVEVPSPRAGTIKELFGKPGDILKVGDPAWSYEGGDNGQAAPTEQPQRTEPAVSEDEEEREDAGTVVGNMSGAVGGIPAGEGKALATPAVRRLARDLGVDIDSIKGSGLAGRVTEKDVRAAAGGETPKAAPAKAPQPAPSRAKQTEVVTPPPTANEIATTVQPSKQPATAPVPVTTTEGSQIIPMRGVRRTIANRLRQSVDMAVHFTVMDEADVSALDEERKRLAAASGEKVSYLPFVVSALCRAVKQHPALNAYVDDENEQIIRHNVVHMGIAADTDQGLSVPVVFNADGMGILQIAREVTMLAEAVRDRSIPRERLMGSTITISNVGSYAGRFATPIINYPEVAILAAGRVHEGVVADKGSIRVAKLLPLSLTCDHRSVDGAEAARCLNTVIELLKKPQELLTPARG